MSKRPRRSYLSNLEERMQADLEMTKTASFHQALIDDQRVRLKVAAHWALPDWAVPQVVDAVAAAVKQERDDALELATCDICMVDGNFKEWRLSMWEGEAASWNDGCIHAFCRTCAHRIAKPALPRVLRGYTQARRCPFCDRRARFSFYAGAFDSTCDV
jgi:hypothetical protein